MTVSICKSTFFLRVKLYIICVSAKRSSSPVASRASSVGVETVTELSHSETALKQTGDGGRGGGGKEFDLEISIRLEMTTSKRNETTDPPIGRRVSVNTNRIKVRKNGVLFLRLNGAEMKRMFS